MLAFFRTYQKFFYTAITVVIVISFSFFGTYGTMTEDTFQDNVAFTAVNGTKVSRSELERMALFIGTDAEDMRQFGGVWGPNFFNDGVIEKDFLNTGIAQILAEQYPDELRPDLESKLAREKRFTPYVHPGNSALSAQEVWSRSTPDKIDNLKILTESQDPLSPKSINARVDLYLSERAFSGWDLKQSIMYIEQMNSQYMRQDPNLPYSDLSLFGYHTAEDWLGQRFVKLMSAFIINSAIIAEQKGYQVSKEEVLADLIRNASISFAQIKQQGRLGVNNPTQYFQEHLRRMHIDQNQAIKTWRQVMLFRRMFHDIGNAVVTDPFTFKEFHAYAKDSVTGELFALPADLQLSSFRDLQLFETYLKSVAPKTIAPLDLPQNYLSMDEVPEELIQQSYLIEIGEANKTHLQTRVGIRQMWDWQMQDENWSKLVDQFPELADSKADSPDTRSAALDVLDEITRSRLDSFSRRLIVEDHPDWVAESLEKGPKGRRTIAVRAKGGSDPLPGVEDRITFMAFLNDPSADKARIYTPDDKTYYMITVIEKGAQLQILTFVEAKREGVLSELLDKDLQKYYETIREASPKDYQLPDGGWKELQYVRDSIAERYFSKVLQAISDQTGIKTPDAAATKRLVPYVKQVRQSIEADPTLRSRYVKAEEAPAINEALTVQATLEEQWKLIGKPFTSDRSSPDLTIFHAEPNTWTDPTTLPNGAISFRYIKGRAVDENGAAIIRGTERLHKLLSSGSQQVYARTVLGEMQDKNAVSLSELTPKE